MTMPEQQPAGHQRLLVGLEALDRLAQLVERGASGELADDVSLGRRHGQLGPHGRRPLRDARHHLDAGEGQADRTVGAQAVIHEQGGVAVEGAGAGDAAEHRDARGAARHLGQHEVGRERVGVREQDDARRLVEVGQPADGDRVGTLGDVEMEGLGATVAQRRSPNRHRRAALDLAPVADHAPGAAADEHRRRERLVHALERGLRRGQVRAGREDADHVGAPAS